MGWASAAGGIAGMGNQTQNAAINNWMIDSQKDNIAHSTGVQVQLALMQSQMMLRQSSAFESSAAAYSKQAGMFMDQAKYAKKIGEMRSAQEYARARQAEIDAERASVTANEQRRQKIGGAIATFAGHGVSVDAGNISAVSLWEQDEVADLALEMGNIREKRDNEVWGYMFQGNEDRMQGLFDAQALAIQAQGALINAAGDRARANYAYGDSLIARQRASLIDFQGASAIQALTYQQMANFWQQFQYSGGGGGMGGGGGGGSGGSMSYGDYGGGGSPSGAGSTGYLT